MKFRSTRDKSAPVSFSEAALKGLAPDGGLYVPLEFPLINSRLWNSFSSRSSFSEFARAVMAPWYTNDVLEEALPAICEGAFNFPIPLEFITEDTALLELFHGPTAAFKDVGARFLAENLARLPEASGRIVLVATSGDTGGAVAATFFQKSGIGVCILFPKGKVSRRQELQLTTWGENIQALCINGDFDDCQGLVKAALLDPEYGTLFLSANSVNLGRLLPQTLYYAQSSLRYLEKTGRQPGFIVPSGNLGNGVAALWAKKMGFPIREVIFSTNANHSVVDYLEKGIWQPRKTISTLANAMDVGNPSNIERLVDLYPDIQELKKEMRAISVSDSEIQITLRNGRKRWGKLFCPHTATAFFVREKIREPDWIVVATAHPAKFETIVEPLVSETIDLPPSLTRIFSRPSQMTEIHPNLQELKHALKNRICRSNSTN